MSLDKSESATRSARAQSRAADARRNRDEKSSLEGLGENTKPVVNAYKSGKDLELEIDNYRKALLEGYQAGLKNGKHRVRLKTVTEAVLETIKGTNKSAKARKLLGEIEHRQGLPDAPGASELYKVGELAPYLPRFDWRDYEVVPPVCDQGETELCWAITATEALESNLMLKLANFATNDEPQIPNVFRVHQVELNAFRISKVIKENRGRHETVFNHFFNEGVPANEITILAGKAQADKPGQVTHIEDRIWLDGQPPKRLLPQGEDQTWREKILGWDYVRAKNPWKIAFREDLKKALLEHGPLAVAMSFNQFTEYGRQKVDDHCTEVERDPETGMVFKKTPGSGDLFVRLPRKAMEPGTKESFLKREFGIEVTELCPDTFVNLSLNSLDLNDTFMGVRQNRYQVRDAAADCIRVGRHRRRSNRDSDVGTFYDRETDEYIWHFPAGNSVLMEKDPNTGNLCVIFPVNTEAEFDKDLNTGNLAVAFPAGREFEDLAPVFRANRKARMNHFVLLIGWDDGKGAWIIQNSWGEDWGFRCRRNPERGKRGYGYVAYGTFGQLATWVEAPLLNQNLWPDKKADAGE